MVALVRVGVVVAGVLGIGLAAVPRHCVGSLRVAVVLG